MTDAPNPSAAKTEPVAWRVRAGVKHPLVENGKPFDWRLSDKYPSLGDGANLEWFDIEPLYTHPQPSLSVGLDREKMGGGDVIALVDPSRWNFPNAPQLAYANGHHDALALAAPAEGYVLVPEKLVHRAAGLLDCEGYDDTSKQLLACLPAASTGETGA